jgi:hypothetical protein
VIISASRRTDIPAFHAGWFFERLAAGECCVPNPFSATPYRVDLRPEAVDGFVFWTRNFGPLWRRVAEIPRPFYVLFTLTGYPRALEPAVIGVEQAVEQMRALAGRVVWRYDPIVFSSLTPPQFHVENFGRLAEAVAGTTDEVIVSFAQVYRKVRRNLNAAAAEHGFTWEDPPDEKKLALLAELRDIAQRRGMTLSVCCQPQYVSAGTRPAQCVDPARLSAIAGYPIAARRKPTRAGCHCAVSQDIGTYDTCRHGCAYCYAVLR